jgi:hypothetical protein
MTAWPSAVDRLGAELLTAIERDARHRGRRRLPRAVPAVVLAVLALGTGALATSGVIREGIPVPWSGNSAEPTVRPLGLEPLRAQDPGAGPPWAIRLSVAGPVVCQTVGQVIGGRIGVLRGRVFHVLPSGYYHDTCRRTPADGAVVRWSQYPGPNVGRRDSRTVVHGVAGPHVVAVEVFDRTVERRLAMSPRGAFVTAFAGLRTPRSLPVQVTLDDGATKRYGASP